MRSVRSIRKLSYHSTVIVLILVLLASAAGVPMIAAAQEIDRAGNSGPGGTLPPDASLEEMAQLEDVEVRYQASYAHLATGDPSAVPDRSVAASDALRPESVTATHATYAGRSTSPSPSATPFSPTRTTAPGPARRTSITASTSWRPTAPMCSAGRAARWSTSRTTSWGMICTGRWPSSDPEGYIWQYHHIDKNTIPQAIKDKFAQYQADPGRRLHRTQHLHRRHRLLDGGVVQQALQPHPPQHPGRRRGLPGRFRVPHPAGRHWGPQILAVGLTKNNTVQSVTTISGEYGLYVRRATGCWMTSTTSRRTRWSSRWTAGR